MLRQTCAPGLIAFALSMFAATEVAAIAQRRSSDLAETTPIRAASPRDAAPFGSNPQTLAGGEVIVLDSAGYGSVTITQSVAISRQRVFTRGFRISVPG